MHCFRRFFLRGYLVNIPCFGVSGYGDVLYTGDYVLFSDLGGRYGILPCREGQFNVVIPFRGYCCRCLCLREGKLKVGEETDIVLLRDPALSVTPWLHILYTSTAVT